MSKAKKIATLSDINGNVGIGTSSPSSKLDIGSLASVGNLSTLTFSGVNSTTTKTNYVQFVPSIEFDVAGSEAGGFILKTLQNGAYKNSIVAVGALVNNTNFLSFSTTNEAIRITSAGGISFGSSGTAYGTSGQVLTSAANAPPTWATLTLMNLPEAWVKKSVDCATTAALTFNTGQASVDGVALSVTSRVLIKDQVLAYQNGIYTGVTTTNWVRAADAATSGDIAGATVNVDGGTFNYGWKFNTFFKTTDILDTTIQTWVRFLDSGSQMLNVLTGTTTVNTGQIFLNGATSNRIDFNTNGTGIPTVTNISAGTKIVLKSAISGALVDYAIGTDSATGGGVWNSVPSTAFNFKWYAGATQVATIAGLTAGGKFFTTQPVPATATATATLTIAQMLASIVATPAAAVSYTLPTGTLMDTTIGTYVAIGMGFEWSILNVAAFVITVSAGVTHTLPVAVGTIAIGSVIAPTTARFRTIKTAANTYTTYRI